jgi:hypothetical protein
VGACPPKVTGCDLCDGAHTGAWCRCSRPDLHANFLFVDLLSRTYLHFEPHGGRQWLHRDTQASILRRSFQEQLDRLGRVFGHIQRLHSTWQTCPYYGLQWVQQLAFKERGILSTGLCALMGLMFFEGLLASLCRDPVHSEQALLQRFRDIQVQQGASNSPLNLKALDRVWLSMQRFANEYA